MKFFLLGDFGSNNGPGVANKEIQRAMQIKYMITVSKQMQRIPRIIEMVMGILTSQAVLICSKSQLNYLAIRLAKCFNKPVYYILHGYASYEEELNGTVAPGSSELKLLKEYDEYIFTHADRIICVSRYAMEFMQKTHPQIRNRFDYIYNAVSLPQPYESEARYPHTVLSIGAHMRRKQCLPVAKAIEHLRGQGKDYRLILVGDTSGEYEAIRHFDFVEWRKPMPHDELLRLMAQCPVYIQNSAFDTFALAPIEALYEGASILLSNRVGCKDLFDDLRETDIISDPENIEEIAADIDFVMQHPNHQRMLKGMRQSSITVEAMAQRFAEIFGSDA